MAATPLAVHPAAAAVQPVPDEFAARDSRLLVARRTRLATPQAVNESRHCSWESSRASESPSDNRKGLMLLGVNQATDLEVFRPGDVAVPDRLPALPQRLSTLHDLVPGYLIRFRPATQQAYQGDLASWLTFCDQARIDPLTAGIHHADTYLRVLDELGDPHTRRRLSPASISRRVSAVAGFYRCAVRQRAVAESPF